MEFVRIVVGIVLPYIAVLVFLVGMVYRLYTWKTLVSPAMTLFPAAPTGRATALNTLEEAILFKSLFYGDRVLWGLAWIFHAVLALIVLGHFRVFTGLIDATLEPLIGKEGVLAMSSGAGGVAGVVILITVALLLIRRITLQRAGEITGLADYLALVLIGVVVITGNMMRFGGERYHGFLTQTREYFAGLATFSNVTGMDALQDDLFLVHMGLAFMLIMAIPFSKVLHFGGIFFTQQLIKKQ